MSESNEDRWFLIIRDRHLGSTHVREFDDDDQAWDAYLRAEDEYRACTYGADPKVEVVLVGADSYDGLVRSYRHYFEEGDRPHRQERLIQRLKGWESLGQGRHSRPDVQIV